jgi:hypothetical protein
MVQVQEMGGAARTGASKVQYQKGLAWGPEGGDNIVFPCSPSTYDMTYSYYDDTHLGRVPTTTFYNYRWNICTGLREWDPNNDPNGGNDNPPNFPPPPPPPPPPPLIPPPPPLP